MRAVLLLFINIIAVVCWVTAYGFWTCMDNPVAAVFPALVFCLVAAFQPWLVLLLLSWFVIERFWPDREWFAIIAAPVLSVPITLFVYQALSRRGKWAGLHRAWLRYPPRLWAVFAGSVGLVVMFVSYAGYRDVPVQHRGIPSALFWSDAQRAERFSFSNSRCYTQFRYAFPDTNRYLWQVQVPRNQLPRLMKTLEMERVPAQMLPADFWNQQPVWWQRPEDGRGEEYTRGDVSEQAVDRIGIHQAAFYDEATQTLYFWDREIGE